jgi:uncharacterized coiled-coil protein SlyX
MHHDTNPLMQRLEQLEKDHAAMRRRSRGMMALAFLAVTGVLLASPGSRKALAQQTGGLPTFSARVAALESRMAAVEATNAQQSTTITNLQTALNQEIANRQAADTALQNRATTVEAKTQYMSVSAGEMFITGTNLYIQNGTGTTYTANSFGNLIIGYNESRPQGYVDTRTGSHNLVIGDHQNYSSWGGIVAGFHNEISGQYASITGGQFSIASGAAASISGGSGSTASGAYSSISGGDSNTASGQTASVSGGASNKASGLSASVSGGANNKASGQAASVSGGDADTASGSWASWASGGQYNTASGDNSSISGGFSNTAGGSFSSVSGGGVNQAIGNFSSISGGTQNTTNGYSSSISGGGANNANGNYSSLSGGGYITITDVFSWAGGSYHTP